MKIDLKEYQIYITRLKEKIIGQKLYSPILLNNETMIFPFEDLRGKYLVISLNNNHPLIYIIQNDIFFSSLETNKFLKFKKAIGKTIIKDIKIKDDDFIVELCLTNIDTNNDINLVAELISKKPDLVIENNGFVSESFLGKHKNDEAYIYPQKSIIFQFKDKLTDEILVNHFKNEINIRKKQKYATFAKFLTAKLKLIRKKINEINNDVINAKDNLKCEEMANEIFTLGYNLKGHYDSVCLSNGCIKLDESKTLLENIEKLYKKTKKAKETIKRSETNILNAQNELKQFEDLYNLFINSDEKEADKLIEIYGNKNKKKEVTKTPFNSPFSINLNGTYFYFGKNASQNDYLSFAMKLDRDYTWFHIKDLSGSHIIICSKKPTDNEILFACEIALLCSKVNAAEVIYTKKKNIRRGHTLGEAIVKNYSTIKINSVRKGSADIFAIAKKLD